MYAICSQFGQIAPSLEGRACFILFLRLFDGWRPQDDFRRSCRLLTRSLEEFDAAVSVHGKTLEKDLLIKHHLGILYDQLLESNLLKIIQVCACGKHTGISF